MEGDIIFNSPNSPSGSAGGDDCSSDIVPHDTMGIFRIGYLVNEPLKQYTYYVYCK